MLVNYLPSWLAALLLASFLAAILSTFAMTALAPATIFTVDIYKNLFRPNATEKDMARTMRITIVVLAVIAMTVAAFLPPILAAMNWLFSWLVPIFWVVLFGLFWKRSGAAAVATLVAAWIANSAWSFTDLPQMLNMAEAPNAYITLVVTLLVGVGMNLIAGDGARGSYFKSADYRARLESAAST
jgi:SSS family solute:Na+ symporter